MNNNTLERIADMVIKSEEQVEKALHSLQALKDFCTALSGLDEDGVEVAEEPTEPTEPKKEEKPLTLYEVREEFSAWIKDHSKEEAAQVLMQFDAKKFSDLKESDYDQFLQALRR